MRLGRWAGAVIGVTLVGLAPAALAGPLNDAAAIVGANDPLGRPQNDHLVPFNRTYRVNPHNTYNPNTVVSLNSALGAGARVLEIDIYNSMGPPRDMPTCLSMGGEWSEDNLCFHWNVETARTSLRTTLSDVIAGAPPASRIGQNLVDIDVKHDPTAEDGWMDTLASVFFIPTFSSTYYGNNCASGSVPGLANLNPQVARCLQKVKDWSDEHPGHTPVVIYLDVKNDPSPEAAMALDIALRHIFGSKLYTPAELKGGFSSPRARVASQGWPSVATLRDKVIAIYNGGEVFQVWGVEQPNDTLRMYLDHIKNNGFEPAAFVCPRISNSSQVDAPVAFTDAERLGYVVCSNIYTGQHASTQQTNSRPYEHARNLVLELSSRNILSYVFSYEDPLALYPEVALDFVAAGVSYFDSELHTGHAELAFFRTELHFLPPEGLSGITNYGFVIRQKNSPLVLTSDPLQNGQPILKAYDGLPSQQWGITSAGQLFALSDPTRCLMMGAAVPTTNGGFPVRKKSRYNSITGHAYYRNATLGWGEAIMGNCATEDQSAFITPMSALDQGVTSGGGIVLALNDNKFRDKGRQYLTADGFTEGSRFTAGPRTDLRITTLTVGSRGQRSKTYAFRAAMEGPNAAPVTPETVFAQEFDLYFDKPAAMVVDPAVYAPPKAQIAVADEARGGIPKLPVWRDFLPMTSVNYNLALNNPYLSEEERGIYWWGYWNAGYQGGSPPDGSLFYNKFTRDLTDPAQRTIPTIGPNGLFTGRSMPLQQAASELLSPTEYAKWLSAVDTTEYDVPRISDWENNEHFTEALQLLGTGLGSQDWGSQNNPNCNTKWCRWYRRPVVPRDDELNYWDFPNKPSVHLAMGMYLTSIEEERWRQRLDMTPQDIYLDPGLEPVAIQLLETNWGSTVGTGARTEQSDWFAEAQHCWFEPPAGQTPYQHCPNRYLAAKPGHSGSAYLWNDVPFSNVVLAETVFKNPRAGFPQFQKPDDWALWAAGRIVYGATNGQPTYKDVPVTAQYNTVVTGSDLLTGSQKQKYLEKYRVHTQLVANNIPVTHVNVDPDDLVREVADDYLNDVELALWEERTAVTVDDFPKNTSLVASSAKGTLLSTAEQTELDAYMAQPGSATDAIPTQWPDVPPAREKRFAAQYLLPGAEYTKWLSAKGVNQDGFPFIWTNDAVKSLAQQTLNPAEYTAWLGKPADRIQASNLAWWALPRASNAVIAERLLNSNQKTFWTILGGQPFPYQLWGKSPALVNEARSYLGARSSSARAAVAAWSRSP